MKRDSGGRRVQSVDTSCRIIDALRRSGGSTVSALADRIGLSAGTVHTHLATLKDHGYVVQNDRTYKLGPQVLTLGEHFRNNHRLYQSAKEEIEELAEETGESAHLIVEHRGRVLALHEVFGDDAVGVEYHARKREESLRHLHCTASGKAILSQYPREQVESIIDEHGLEQKTPNTITDLETLFDQLEAARERGFAFNDEEQAVGLRAVGAPIMRSDGQVEGALSVSAPTNRLKGTRFQEELPESVMRAANIVEVNLNSRQSV